MTIRTAYGSRLLTEAGAVTARKSATAALIDTERKWSRMSEDLIRRSDAIKALKREKSDWNNDYNVPIDHCIERLNKVKSADRPQGKWLDYEIPLEDGGAMPIQVCNLCKTFYPLAYTGGGHRFCPNCGAEMKGANDE